MVTLFFLYLSFSFLLFSFKKKKWASPNFDGKRFFNIDVPKRSLIKILKRKLSSKPTPWPKKRLIVPEKDLNRKLDRDELVVTFVNHSTMLIRWGDLNILTDPIWSKRAGPFNWIGPKRVHAPGIDFADLPRIDIILLSHNHYDHLDLRTLRKLTKLNQVKIITGLGNAVWLESKGIYGVIECDWWQRIQFREDFEVIFTPAQHFSARTLFDYNKTLWGGFVFGKENDWVYFSGDTAYFDVFKKIKKKFGTIRLAFLPIGAFKPQWLMNYVHMSPKEAVKAHIELDASTSIAMHFGTFHLSDEGIDEPCQALSRELQKENISLNKFWILDPGESRQVF